MTRDYIGAALATAPGLTKEHRLRLRELCRPKRERVEHFQQQGHNRALARELASREVMCDAINNASSFVELKEALLAFIINASFRHSDK